MWLVFQQLTLKLDGNKFDYYDSAIIYHITISLYRLSTQSQFALLYTHIMHILLIRTATSTDQLHNSAIKMNAKTDTRSILRKVNLLTFCVVVVVWIFVRRLKRLRVH